MGAEQPDPVVTLALVEHRRDHLPLGLEPRDDHDLERIHAAGRGGDLCSQTPQAELCRDDVEEEVELGLESRGDTVDASRRRPEAVAPRGRCAPERRLLDLDDGDARNGARREPDLDLVGRCERRGAHELGPVERDGGSELAASRGAALLERPHRLENRGAQADELPLERVALLGQEVAPQPG
ncbi:MAG: hypothetical protein A2Y55_05555 [Actinobacteria bacterium RBG_16_68_12]|nr:MAG: hypothetical protein A2Y55_05555 [Actinobacteria bacterium RBG_16_68_12]